MNMMSALIEHTADSNKVFSYVWEYKKWVFCNLNDSLSQSQIMPYWYPIPGQQITKLWKIYFSHFLHEIEI